MFAQFDQQMCAQGFTASKGQSVDATTSGNATSEDEQGGTGTGKRRKSAAGMEMDCDARWTVITMPGKTDKEGKKKPGICKPVHGCKNHVSIDNGHWIILAYEITSAAHANGKVLWQVVRQPNSNKKVYARRGVSVARNRGVAEQEWLVGDPQKEAERKGKGEENASHGYVAR